MRALAAVIRWRSVRKADACAFPGGLATDRCDYYASLSNDIVFFVITIQAVY